MGPEVNGTVSTEMKLPGTQELRICRPPGCSPWKPHMHLNSPCLEKNTHSPATPPQPSLGPEICNSVNGVTCYPVSSSGSFPRSPSSLPYSPSVNGHSEVTSLFPFPPLPSPFGQLSPMSACITTTASLWFFLHVAPIVISLPCASGLVNSLS